MAKNILKIRIILWLILAAAVGWLAYLKIVPSGKISYVYDFSRSSYFIRKISPAERLELGQGQALVKGDPIYFFLRPPRRFAEARLTVKFKNTTNFPIMEIGLLNNKDAWSFDLKPLQNKIIDQLSLAWPVVYGQNGARLIEREKKYDTVEQFLANLPDIRQMADEIAVYNYSLKTKFLLDNYQPSNEKIINDYKFRGSYQFYTYIKQEELDYVFNFIDLNVNQDSDPVEIKVYSPDGLIYSAKAIDEKTAGDERQAAVRILDLPEAVYRFSLIADNDIITKNIVSRQSQFVLINKVWLAEGNKKNPVLFTNSRLINAQTINPSSLGKIKVGQDFIDLSQTYKQFSLPVSSRPAIIELDKDDVIISGDGVFSFQENGLLDPRLKNVDGNLDIQKEKINYVLTNYQTPENFAGWQTAEADFDLTKAYQENGEYRFLISIPGLKAEESTEGAVIIKEIKAELSGTTLRQKLNKFYNRIMKK